MKVIGKQGVNLNIKILIVSMLFLGIIFSIFPFSVYAVTDSVNEDATKFGSINVETIYESTKNYYAELFMKAAEENFSNMEIVQNYKVSYYDENREEKSTETYPMIITTEDVTSAIDSGMDYCDADDGTYTGKYQYLEAEIDGVVYKIKTYYTRVNISYTAENPNYDPNDPESGDEYIRKSEIVNKDDGLISSYMDSSIAQEYKNQYKVAVATKKFLKEISEYSKLGLIAGSVGSGYNVGSYYTTNQIPLSDAMEKVGQNYDFKSNTGLRTSFDYYMSPLIGRINAEDKPTSDEDWFKLMSNSNFVSGNSVTLSGDFIEFRTDLSADSINEKGLKITDKLEIKNGVTTFKNIRNRKAPKSVLSYTLRIAYPYIFVRFGDNTYKLDSNSLRVDNDFYFCIYNDYIYDSNFKIVTSRASMNISRNQLYLFNQQSDEGFPFGVVLIGTFMETVVDTSTGGNGFKYATGRQVSFTNGYSDLLTLNRENVNLMYTVGEGGTEGYIPKNVAFIPDDTEVEILDIQGTMHPEFRSNNPDSYKILAPYDNLKILEFVQDSANHMSIESNPPYIKMLMGLDGFSNVDEVNMNLLKSTEDYENSGAYFSFVIYRNNWYINDNSLISWLRTSTAKGMSFVRASELLEKILGEFKPNEKLTYSEWKDMQEIRSYLTQQKDNTIVHIFNITSIVIGVFFICFAILICLFYWIDVFNTFTRFSLLNSISMHRLYPIENKDLIPVNDSSGVKYVTFKEVLVIAFLMVAAGILFLEIHNIISLIVRFYFYILSVLGGK